MNNYCYTTLPTYNLYLKNKSKVIKINLRCVLLKTALYTTNQCIIIYVMKRLNRIGKHANNTSYKYRYYSGFYEV